MKFWSKSFDNRSNIPTQFAFGKYDEISHVELSENKNPHLGWSDLPAGTKSLVLICHDTEVPSCGDDVNQEGRTVPYDLKRVDFYHWVLIDLKVTRTKIQEGEFCSGITAKGKSGPQSIDGAQQGLNNYTQWFDGDEQMGGNYFGYDGPCPPWNDERMHQYHFTLYALDVERCAVDGNFDGPQVLKAIEGHEFFQAITNSAGLNLHINVHYGENKHHIVESIFKCFARAMDQATKIDPRSTSLPSTKGKL